MSDQGMFDKIDKNFSGAENRSKMFLIFGGFAALVAWVIYSGMEQPATDYMNNAVSKNKSLTDKLISDKNYIRQMSCNSDNKRCEIEKREKKITRYTALYNDAKDKNNYVDKKIKELSYLLFDNKNWAKFLDRVSTQARKYNVKIVNIKSQINKLSAEKKPQQILNVDVELKGSYHSIVKFINALEESLIIVDIHGINLKDKEIIEGAIKIAVWGMKY